MPIYEGMVLGSGGFGRVVACKHPKKEGLAACKEINRAKIDALQLSEYVYREVAILKKLKKKQFIVQYISFASDNDAYRIYTELADHGELFDEIVHHDCFDEDKARKYFQQLIAAVSQCHKEHIVHRDIKAENLLLAADKTLLLCDFGLSRSYNADAASPIAFNSLAGSMDYQAPEILSGENYKGPSCDMWACGCVLFFMLCGYLPFTAKNDAATKTRIMNVEYNRHDEHLSNDAADLIEHLLVKEPLERYSWEDVTRHRWFTKDLPHDVSEVLNLQQNTGSSSFASQTVISYEQVREEPFPPAPTLDYSFQAPFGKLRFNRDAKIARNDVKNVLSAVNDGKQVTEKEVDKSFPKEASQDTKKFTCEEFLKGCAAYATSLNKKFNSMEMHKEFRMAFLREVFNEAGAKDGKYLQMNSLYRLAQSMEREMVKKRVQEVIIDSSSSQQESSLEKGISFEIFSELVTRYHILRDTLRGVHLEMINILLGQQGSNEPLGPFPAYFMVSGTPGEIFDYLKKKSGELKTTFSAGSSEDVHYAKAALSNGESVETNVILTRSLKDYTRIESFRVVGATKNFHIWFKDLRKALQSQVEQFQKDTSIVGDSELL